MAAPILRCCCFLLLLLHTTAACSNTVIVGGGLSGLATALELESQGCTSLVILEASSRLGGRVHTFSDGELGGAHLHGIGSRLAHLVKEYQLPRIQSGGDSAHPAKDTAEWKLHTVTLNKHEMEERGSLLLKEWNEQVQSMLLSYNATAKQDEIQAHLKKVSNDAVHNVTSTSLDRALLQFELKMAFEHDRGLPFHQHAVEGIFNDWDWKEYEGSDSILLNGMQSLIERMRSELRHTEIHVNALVDRIVYTNDTCTVAYNKKFLTSRACIVTIPLGVLKARHSELFSPMLPQPKHEALQRAGVAVYNTLLLTWEQPGICNAGAYYLLQNNDTTNTNPLSSGFVCPQYLRNNRKSVTQFYIYGDQHPFDNETYWKEQAVDVMAATLNRTFSIQDVKSMKLTAWHKDPLFMGSYSAPSTFTKSGDRRVLQESVGAVYFAGEHTHTFRYQSLDGAYDSGIRAAQEVVAATTTCLEELSS